MRKQRWFSFVVILTTFGLALSVISPLAVLGQTKSNFRGASDFAPGDGVRLKVWRDVSVSTQGDVNTLGLNDDFIIDNRGNIALPIIGDMRAIGHTRRSLARAIEDSLNIRAVRVMCAPLIRLTLLGAVNKPGSYLIEPKESLWGLINEADGPANGADVKKIYVERSGEIVIRNLLQAFEEAHSLEQLGVRSGDQIYVPGISNFNWRTIVDYATLSASFVLLYFQFKDRTR
jgi:protein involved in polysaccharide export with SLBB domain